MVFQCFVEQFPFRLQPIFHIAPLNTPTLDENLIGAQFDFFAAWFFLRPSAVVPLLTFRRLRLQGLYYRDKTKQRLELLLASEVSDACRWGPFHSSACCRSIFASS